MVYGNEQTGIAFSVILVPIISELRELLPLDFIKRTVGISAKESAQMPCPLFYMLDNQLELFRMFC
jgi:hypothetical protein